MRLLTTALLFIVAALQTQQVRETRFDVPTPATTDPVSMAISSDGDKIVFVADSQGGKAQLWVHSLSTGMSRPLPGTEGISAPGPCWSPDNRNIAFLQEGRLKRMDIETGATQVLANIPAAGCTWSRSGTILVGTVNVRAILRVSEGGPIQPAMPMGTLVATQPRFLPDDRHFLYFAVGDGVYVGELSGGTPKRLLASDTAAFYTSGHLLFARGETLYAQPFDPETQTLSGEPFVVAQPIRMGLAHAAVSVSNNGTIVYRTGTGGSTTRHYKWFDRTGKEAGSVGEPLTVGTSPKFLSPDGRFLVIDRLVNGNTDLWVMEVATGKLTKVTEGPGLHVYPVWGPDSQTLYFAANQTGPFELYKISRSATGSGELVLHEAGVRAPRDISRDGRFILYKASGIAALQLDGNPPGDLPVVQSPSANWAQFSPDTRWVAYQSSESGRSEISVQQFPSGRTIRITKDGGAYPRWGADGNELFYIDPENRIMAVSLNVSGDTPKVETPAVLFSPQILSSTFATSTGFIGAPYLVSQDGKRFLIETILHTESPIKVIKNWQPGK